MHLLYAVPADDTTFAIHNFVDAQSQGNDVDDQLLHEYYTKFKGGADEKKYSLIPKFYSKVNKLV